MVTDFIAKLTEVLTEVESFLADKNGTVQTDMIIQHVISKIDIPENEVSKLDLTIRYYLNCYSDYEITRGKGGGTRKKGTVKAAKPTKKTKTTAEVQSLVSSKIASIKPINITTKPVETKTNEVDEVSTEEFSEPEDM